MLDLETAARSLTSLQGVAILCSGIGLWALYAYVKLSLRLRPMRVEMKRLCRLLSSIDNDEDLVGRFAEVDELASASRVLGHQWSEFRETLIDPAIGDSSQVLYNSQRAGDFFSRDSLLGEQINLRMFNAMPNLLTGAGILGTFVGLVAGIYLAGTGLADPTKAQAALGDLLAGASLAFLTSIVGLTSSLLFSSAEKHQLHEFEKLRQFWVNGLDGKLRRISLERLTRDTLTESQRQTELLSSFTEQLAFQLTEALERTVPKALETQVGKPLTEAITRLQASVDQMAQNQAQTNEDTLREIVSKFSDSITGAAGEEMREFGQTMKLMSGQLSEQIRAISEQQDAIRQQSTESVTELTRVFREGAAGLQEQVAGSVDTMLAGLDTTLKDMTAQLDAAGKRMAIQLSATATAFGNTVGTLNDSVGEIHNILLNANNLMSYTDQLIASVRQSLGKATEVTGSLEAAAQMLQDTGAKGADAAASLDRSGQRVAEAASAFQESQAQMLASWEDYRGRFEAVDRSLAQAFQEMDTGLQRYTAFMSEFVKHLDEHTSAIASSLAGAVGDLNGGIEDLTDTVSRLAA